MTCIVAISNKNHLIMGADSCVSNDTSWMTAINPKIFKLDNFIIGAAGSFRIIDLLRFSFNPPKHPITLSDDAYMRTKFVNYLRKLILANTSYTNDMETDVLVAYKNNIYVIQDDFSILNPDYWGYAIGSGESAARGSLYSTKDNNNIKFRAQIALESAEMTTQSVKSPFIFIEN